MAESETEWPLFTGALSFTLRAPDQEDAEKRMREMVGAAKSITPQEFALEVKASVVETPIRP